MKPAHIPTSEDAVLPDKGNSTSDSGVVTADVRMNTMEGKKYQPESNTDATKL